MSDSIVAKRYARAIFEIAAEKQALEPVEQQLKLVDAAVSSDKDVQSFWLHPRIDAKAKKEALKKAFAGQLSDDVTALLELLIDRSREEIVGDLAGEYVAMANAARNVVDATVYTALPLKQDEMVKLSEQFGRTIGKTVRMENEVDASIIGGMIVRIGDHLFDGSIKGKLSRFKQNLVHS